MEAGEVWKDIPGVPGYQASSLGNIKNAHRQITLSRNDVGRANCSIARVTRKVHQLVALAFLGPRPEGSVVMHLNHKPGDNRPANLRYGTTSENIRMDFVSGARCHKGGNAPNKKLTEVDVLVIRKSPLSNASLAEVYGVGRSTISKVRRNRTWAITQNAADSYLVGNPPTGETHMAKAPKSLTAAEKKLALANLKTATKAHSENVKSISAALKEVEKARALVAKDNAIKAKALATQIATAKKAADTMVAAAFKTADAETKAFNATMAKADKDLAAATAKAEKAKAAAEVGAAKLAAQIAALEAVPVVAAKAKAVVPETEAA